MPLNRPLCALMTSYLIDDFDRLESQFDRVAKTLPHVGERDDYGKLRAELEALRLKMQQPRYYVGFLGRSQVGKSSTLNNVLAALPGEEPCTGGKGAPATSTATRIYRNPEPAANHGCNLKFLTAEEFARRRDGLCETLNLRADLPNDRLVADLDARIKKAEEAPVEDEYAPKAPSEGDQVEDYRFFRRLLRSRAQFPDAIRKSDEEVVGDFARRAEYTNHPEGDAPWRHALLRQVEIPYRTEMISEKIELIDLPGLGARMRADDLLTEGFLHELDGALIFQSSEQVASKEAYDLLEKLGNQFPRMRGRVWMVITRADSISRVSLGYDSPTSIFDNVAKILEDKKVPLSQVLMAGNEFHRKAKEEPGGLPPSRVCDLLNLDRDGSGNPVLPRAFEKHPDLLAAYREVMADGGIARLRDVIGRLLAEEVEREVRDEVAKRVASIRKRLGSLVRTARDASQMSKGSFRAAVDWRVGLQLLTQDLGRDRNILEGSASAVADHLIDVFTQICPSNLVISEKGIRGAHSEYAQVLEEMLRTDTLVTLLPEVHDKVSARLADLESRHGKVRLDDHDGPVGSWEERRAREEADLSCLSGPGVGFLKPDLFPGSGPPALNDAQYREIMPRKIRAVAHALAFGVGQRLRTHLAEMIDGLTLLRNAEGHGGGPDPRPYDEILADLAKSTAA